MPDRGLTHLALPVRDLDASIAFYADYAGLAAVHRRPGVVWLSDRQRPFVLVLAEETDPFVPLRPFAHIGVALESRAAVDAVCARARAAGCLIDGPCEAPAPVGYWAYLRDPDGHTLEVSFGQDIGATTATALS